MKYFDLHCDTPYECYFKKRQFYSNDLAVSGECGRCFEDWKQTFAVWIKDDADEPFLLYRQIMEDFKRKIKIRPKNLTPIFSVEGGAVIEGNPDRLFLLKQDGIRFITLTWNGENRIAGGSKTEAGLTEFGKKVIKRMNELRIACDLSHLNDKSFFEVAELARKPLATHSNCRAICDILRNLTDEQLKLIAKKGGIIGLCLYPAFLGGDLFEKFYENISHMLDMGLEKHIAIGSDFDGAEMDSRMNNASKIPALYECMYEKGIRKTTLDAIFFKNADKYMRNL